MTTALLLFIGTVAALAAVLALALSALDSALDAAGSLDFAVGWARRFPLVFVGLFCPGLASRALARLARRPRRRRAR